MNKKFQIKYLLLINSLLNIYTYILTILTKNNNISLKKTENKLIITLLRNDKLIENIHLQIENNHKSKRNHIN